MEKGQRVKVTAPTNNTEFYLKGRLFEFERYCEGLAVVRDQYGAWRVDPACLTIDD